MSEADKKLLSLLGRKRWLEGQISLHTNRPTSYSVAVVASFRKQLAQVCEQLVAQHAKMLLGLVDNERLV